MIVCAATLSGTDGLVVSDSGWIGTVDAENLDPDVSARLQINNEHAHERLEVVTVYIET